MRTDRALDLLKNIRSELMKVRSLDFVVRKVVNTKVVEDRNLSLLDQLTWV